MNLPNKDIYTEENIKSLDWKEHIRHRPGMYIGKLGDGASYDDGIYILLKEVIDNSIDEFVMGEGRLIEVSIDEFSAKVRDYGRGIPLGAVIDCVSKMNTGGKYDSRAFKKSVGLNGVGTKAVNALSSSFKIASYRNGRIKSVSFKQGELAEELPETDSELKNGTLVSFTPDSQIFKNYQFKISHVSQMLWHYAFLNTGLVFKLNGEKIESKEGLKDLLNKHTSTEFTYPIIHLKGEDIEVAFSHTDAYGETYFSFVNGQYTPQGGTHQTEFKIAIAKVIKAFYQKDFDTSDIRASIFSAVSIKVMEPIFESQTKTKLGSLEVAPGGPTMRMFINNFLSKSLDNYLHRNPKTAEILLQNILQSEKERKEIQGIRKLAKKRSREASLHNKKLKDCRVHYNSNSKKQVDLANKSMLFITEGDSASGSITKARDVNFQAVFSLKGKPLNSYGLSKKVVYENEEFNLLQAALNVEEGIENLKYNKIIIATDADVDGMHIRLLLITFFLQYFPEVISNNHLFVLETPLFRVRNKKKTIYCYSEAEKEKAINQLKNNPEITRFKGLGEISPNEFKYFIDENIRLSQVQTDNKTPVNKLLSFYMGKNTPDRQQFIINNLKVEKNSELISA